MLRLLRADLERDLKELAPSSLGGAREEERISIAINADSIATWALPALTDLAQQGLPMEIIHDDQNFTHEWLREGQVLGCVTTLKQALRGCKVEPLGAMQYIAVATPAFAQSRLGLRDAAGERQAAPGLTQYNFREVPFIAFNRKDELPVDFVGKAFGLKRVTLNQLFVPSSEGMVRAVLAGWGVSVVPAPAGAGPDRPGPARQRGAPLHAAHPALLALLEPGVRGSGRADGGAQAVGGPVAGAVTQRARHGGAWGRSQPLVFNLPPHGPA